MMPLTKRIHQDGKTVASVARELSLDNSNVFHFIARRYHKVGRQARREIRRYFIQHGWLPAPKPRPRHVCPGCLKVHVISRKHETQIRNSNAPAQSQTVAKESAAR